MAQTDRRDLELAQYKKLTDTLLAVSDQDSILFGSTLFDDEELRQIGVVRGAELSVADPEPCDFEPRFFSPNRDMEGELMGCASERAHTYSCTLTESVELSRARWKPGSTPVVQGAGYMYPITRAEWFMHTVERWNRRYRHDEDDDPRM